MPMWKRPGPWAVGWLAAAVLAACGGGGEPAEEAPEMVMEQPAGGMEGMQMPGMGGMPASAGMMDRMEAHLRSLQGADGERLRAMLPQHRQMVANLISQMNREMRDMNMAADPEWNAALQAIRDDLVRMPEMTAAELEGLMPGHRERVTRLVEMHRGMMKHMQM